MQLLQDKKISRRLVDSYSTELGTVMLIRIEVDNSVFYQAIKLTQFNMEESEWYKNKEMCKTQYQELKSKLIAQK